MSRTRFVAGNWKMNTAKAGAIELAKGVAKGVPAGVQVGIAPPFVYLDAVGQAIAGSSVLLGAQDAYFEKNGAFTGEISLEMLKDLGVKFVLAGHSDAGMSYTNPRSWSPKRPWRFMPPGSRSFTASARSLSIATPARPWTFAAASSMNSRRRQCRIRLAW